MLTNIMGINQDSSTLAFKCFTMDVVTTYKIVMLINILDIPCQLKFSKVIFHQYQCYCLKHTHFSNPSTR
jgi:hypothetical protein